MAQAYVWDVEDGVEWHKVYFKLCDLRKQYGLTHEQAGVLVGKSLAFTKAMENPKTTPQVGDLQLWARIFGLRVNFDIEGFWLYRWDIPELDMMFRLSRPFADDMWHRMWLMAALKAFRIRQGVASRDVAVRMGVSRKAVTNWEEESGNPFVARAFAHARACGGRVTIRLFDEQSWRFDQ